MQLYDGGGLGGLLGRLGVVPFVGTAGGRLRGGLDLVGDSFSARDGAVACVGEGVALVVLVVVAQLFCSASGYSDKTFVLGLRD